MLTAAMIDKTERDLDPWASALLIDLEQNLDGDLTLTTLARAAGSSPFQFHRQFAKVLGETPKRRVTRLRLERAARLLAITGDRVLDIGLSVGFNSHESFCRAFRRAFGQSPSTFRGAARMARDASEKRTQRFRGWCCELSEVRFERRPPTHLLAIRKVGAYAGFSPVAREQAWRELVQWAGAQGVKTGDARMGLYPDDPMLTPGPMQCADLCVPIEAPFPGAGKVRCLELSGGLYGVIDHFGPYETIIQAHRMLAAVVQRSGAYALADGPPLQMFQTVAEGGNPSANRTQVWTPVRKASYRCKKDQDRPAPAR